MIFSSVLWILRGGLGSGLGGPQNDRNRRENARSM